MVFDYSKLRGKIVENFGTQQAFSRSMNFSERTLSLKLNSKISWTQPEMKLACELLDIPVGDIHLYFFTPKVQNV